MVRVKLRLQMYHDKIYGWIGKSAEERKGMLEVMQGKIRSDFLIYN